jgi:hypothetical protein
VHSDHDNTNANGIVIDSGAEVVVGGNLQCSVRTLGQGPLGVVNDDNEIGSGQIAAPCTFRHEGRNADLRCGLHEWQLYADSVLCKVTRIAHKFRSKNR